MATQKTPNPNPFDKDNPAFKKKGARQEALRRYLASRHNKKA